MFAYARISPDGKYLAYASEDSTGSTASPPVIKVLDLANDSVVFAEQGVDAYWSPDGGRMVFLSTVGGRSGKVSIRHHGGGAITRDVASPTLGDYFSWGLRDGRDLILTIRGIYYYLAGDVGILPSARMLSCEGIGIGERPLLSKDGRRATIFVDGELAVRNLTDCDDVIRTGLPGAKADFSWDGRYVAFHAPKASGVGYEIQIVDLVRRTVRTMPLSGTSLFPSWTTDLRLMFQYDGGDGNRGFMLAGNVLSIPERPLPAAGVAHPSSVSWVGLFGGAHAPSEPLSLVLVWGPWSAHAPQALRDLQRSAQALGDRGVHAFVATEPGSREADAARMLGENGITLERLRLTPARFISSGAHNQNPTTLLFENGSLIDRRLGAQSPEELSEWIARVVKR